VIKMFNAVFKRWSRAKHREGMFLYLLVFLQLWFWFSTICYIQLGWLYNVFRTWWMVWWMDL